MRYLISQSVNQSLNKIQFPLVNPRHRVCQSFRVFSDVKFSNLLRFKQTPLLPKYPLHSYKYGGSMASPKIVIKYQTDRRTDILLTEKKSHYRHICHRNERDICTCIYKIVSLLKSYDNIHGMTYTAKIMLSGIAKIKTGYFDNINDYY